MTTHSTPLRIWGHQVSLNDPPRSEAASAVPGGSFGDLETQAGPGTRELPAKQLLGMSRVRPSQRPQSFFPGSQHCFVLVEVVCGDFAGPRPSEGGGRLFTTGLFIKVVFRNTPLCWT